MIADIPIANAMLCWNSGIDGKTPSCKVVRHPDRTGASAPYQSSVGACFTAWRKLDDEGRKFQLMIEAWHLSAFYDVPARLVHEALLVVPEYRSMIAHDFLPRKFASDLH